MMSELYRKLLAAREQMSFEKTPAKGLDYMVFDGDSILEMVGDALAAQGILFVPSIVHAEMTFTTREKAGKNNTVYVQHVQHALATLELRFIDTDTGDVMEATTSGSAMDINHDKALGKAQTYGIKYFFIRMFLQGKSDINDEEKIDNPERAKPARPEVRQKRETTPPASDNNDSFPTIGAYWPSVASSLLEMQIKGWHDGLPSLGGIVYPPAKMMGYKSDSEVKKVLGFKSSYDFDGTLEELLNAVLEHAPIQESE